MQLHYDRAKVNLSSAKCANTGVHRPQRRSSRGRWAPFPCNHFPFPQFPPTPPSCTYPRHCLTRQLRAASAAAWSFFESAVCSDRHQFKLHLLSFLFLYLTEQPALVRPSLPPSHSLLVSAGTGTTTACMFNCLITMQTGVPGYYIP